MVCVLLKQQEQRHIFNTSKKKPNKYKRKTKSISADGKFKKFKTNHRP